MKLLGNPKVVVALALVALCSALYQTYQPHKQHFLEEGAKGGAPAATATAAPTGAAAAAAAATNESVVPAVPTEAVDRNYAGDHLDGWVNTPQRDPFWQAKPVALSAADKVKPLSQLKLKGIWRQNGVAVAAINRGIYHSGDRIEGYAVDRIENNGVWLLTEGGREFLIFSSQVVATGANRKVGSPNVRKLNWLGKPPDEASTNLTN